MAPRASWKGYVKLAELAFPVALYAAASTSRRVSFHILNRKTGNRVKRQYIDEDTEKPVDAEKQAKAYETADGQQIILDPEEIEAAIPESDKTIRIDAFVPCADIETVYFDRPYFLAPPSGILGESFAVLREGMRRKKVAAIGKAVLFRRARTLLLRAQGPGLVAHSLNFDYEVRRPKDIFDDLPKLKIEGEMLDLARHIIDTKSGKFDPRSFEDRYDDALAELVRAKMEGKEIKAPKPPRETKVVSLMDALRQSVKSADRKKPAPSKKRAASQDRKRKAG